LFQINTLKKLKNKKSEIQQILYLKINAKKKLLKVKVKKAQKKYIYI